jgi:hypothetical protein
MKAVAFLTIAMASSLPAPSAAAAAPAKITVAAMAETTCLDALIFMFDPRMAQRRNAAPRRIRTKEQTIR